MASKYARRLAVPDGFPPLLKDFMREVLRNYRDARPEDPEQWILEFGAEFFADLAAGDGGREEGVGAALEDEMDPDHLEARIREMFVAADKDGNGYVDRKEFKTLIHTFAEELSLPLEDVRMLMAEADVDADGRINFEEFVPLAVDLMEAIYAMRRYQEESGGRDEAARAEAESMLLHGMPKEELEAALRDMFARADTDGSGALSHSEFTEALRGSGLGLTRREINALLAEADEDADGRISYAEFVPVAFGILADIVRMEIKTDRVPTDERALINYLTDLFLEHGGDARLSREDLKRCLRASDLGLSTLQLHALMASANEGDDGLVDVGEFAGAVAGTISVMFAVQTSADKAAALREHRASAEGSTVNGLSAEAFAEAFSHLAEALDPDHTGRCPLEPLAQALAEPADAGGLGLSPEAVRVLVDVGDDGAERGTLALAEIQDQGFRALLEWQEQNLLLSESSSWVA